MIDIARWIVPQSAGAAVATGARKAAAGLDARVGMAADSLRLGVRDAASPEDPYRALQYMVKHEEGDDVQPKDCRPVSLDADQHASATKSTPIEDAAARREIRRNSAAETSKLARLGRQAAVYRALASRMGDDPLAVRALQRMLLDGRLTDKPDLDGQGNVLAYLGQIATQDHAPALDVNKLLGAFTRELDDPHGISQGDGDIGTCVATSVTIAAALANPAEVARLVAGLASRTGTVRLHVGPGDLEGQLLARPANWNADTRRTVRGGTYEWGGERTPSMRLLQPALMDAAMAFRERAAGIDPARTPLKYDPTADAFTPTGTSGKGLIGGHRLSSWQNLNSGLDSHQANFLYERLVGKSTQVLRHISGPGRKQALDAIAARVSAPDHATVPIGVYYREHKYDGLVQLKGWETGGHELLVEGVSSEQGQRVFHVVDPIEGGEHHWTDAQLGPAIDEANIPK